MAATKELIMTSLGERSYVDVNENDTLLQVRALILKELDEEQLPAKDFSFKVNGIRLSLKQEGRKLSTNARVRTLLTAKTPGKEYNSVNVDIGEVTPGSEEALELLKPFNKMKACTKRDKEQWAQDFRKEINSYIYRMGNGDEPQTWPLIRKVELRVAERYLQNCNQIAIVAPIKLAVDDGTAKELLGEQFKRRLLMDSQYGNVFFICTQTDDLEATETMRDHEDVAQRVQGRWERMSKLSSSLIELEKELNDRLLEEEDLDSQVQEAHQQYDEAKPDLDEVLKDNDDDSDIEIDECLLQSLRNVVATNKSALKEAEQALTDFRKENQNSIQSDQERCSRMQKELKTLRAAVRNEYSKSCLQEDFRSGLKELYRKDDDTDGGNDDSNDNIALQDNFNMDVFCISANDYLKRMNIKPSRDGPPNTFFNPADTQVPQLRAFVRDITSRICKSHSKTFVENTNDLLDRMKLLTTDGKENSSGRSAQRMKLAFESEMRKMDPKIAAIAHNFKKVLEDKISRTLTKSLRVGAEKGTAEAMNTVQSWGSSHCRTAQERRPDKNGLYYATYGAVVRRSGVFTSGSAGAVDFNQELCDPMEKEFSTDWQAVLDSTIRLLLSEMERSVLQLCAEVCQSLASSFRAHGLDANRLNTMVNTANRSAISALKSLFEQMGAVAVDAQRKLSRTLLPAVQSQMESSYQAVLSVQGGTGKYMRMKDAMATGAQKVVNRMFSDATRNLLAGIQSVIQRLHAMIASASQVICKTMENVFSMCWDDQSGASAKLIDPAMLKKIRECRDALLPELNRLCEIQAGASALLGIEQEEMELYLMAVETFDQVLDRRLEEAKKKGEVIDLCDSDAEDLYSAPTAPAPSMLSVKVKNEGFSYACSTNLAANNDDKEDDDDRTIFAAFSRYSGYDSNDY
ncbi:hypothetical protein FisN_14Lh361 [Fistulifera solaris]|uniref:DUF7605 domain-containing protein n=1 Tax=Fistulifera solaris TaxID=1519565 RepID=A0A1Z5JIM5_FISSO|nr:hypothetical protein FisN_14Lh361 [Fistulifera solaris]|eukprot:GAX13628.1 hypothetical protein FisN_14Lh361 [Fistulifera solaris]